MRLRIYMDPESGPEDCTDNPALWGFSNYEGAEDPEPESALYDVALWDAYQAAQDEARRLRGLIYAALVDEPWDALELRLGREHAVMVSDDFDEDRQLDIEAELLTHARTRTAPPLSRSK